MKLSERRPIRAFTLIEMIGVLAVIAILAALLLPKIFEAINSARVNNAVVSYNTMKTAVMDHYGKFGAFAVSNGTPLSVSTVLTNFDKDVLLPEQLIDKPFQLKVGTNWIVQLRPCETNGTLTAANAAYALAGGAASDVTGQYVVECVIDGIAEQDALEISKRLDGDKLSAASVGTSDLSGRVKYATASGGATTVLMYVAHR